MRTPFPSTIRRYKNLKLEVIDLQCDLLQASVLFSNALSSMNRDQQTIYYDLPESYKSPSTSNLSPSTSYWELKQANMALQPPQLTHESSLSNLNHQDFRASPLDPNYDSAGSLMEPSVGPDVDVYRQQYSISRDGTKIFPSVSPPYRLVLHSFPFLHDKSLQHGGWAMG